MKFVYIGSNLIDELGKEWPANSYGGENVLNGETVELTGHLADKADKNPNYKRYKPKAASKLKVEEVEAQIDLVDAASPA